MKTKMILPIMGLLMSYQVMAREGGVGNGGDVVVCFDSQEVHVAEKAKKDLLAGIYPFTQDVTKHIASVKLLDFYEYTNEDSIIISSSDYKTILRERLSVIKQKAFPYADFLEKTYKNLTFDSYKSISQIYDENILPNLPESCLIAQVAIQNASNSIVALDSQLFSLMDEVNKAGLVFHEVIYNFLAKQQNSYLTRRLNNQIFQKNLNEISREGIFDLFKTSGFLLGYEYRSYPELGIEAYATSYRVALLKESKILKGITLPKGTEINVVQADEKIHIDATLNQPVEYLIHGTSITLPSNTTLMVEIDKDGQEEVAILYRTPVVVGDYVTKRIFVKNGGLILELAKDFKGKHFSIANSTLIELTKNLKIKSIPYVTLEDFKIGYGSPNPTSSVCYEPHFNEKNELMDCLIKNNVVIKGFGLLLGSYSFSRWHSETLSSSLLLKLVDDKYKISFNGAGVLVVNYLRRSDPKRNDVCRTGEILATLSGVSCI